jgi:glycosidase
MTNDRAPAWSTKDHGRPPGPAADPRLQRMDVRARRSAPRIASLLALIGLALGCGQPPSSPVPGATASVSPGATSGASVSPGATSDAVGTPVPPASPAPVACGGEPFPDARWWHDRVFYEAFVRSWADGDGDGIGDLRGLTARLDYLNDGDPATTDDLGVTGLWLMPVAEAASYHGYDATDLRAVERDYGTAEDLRALVDAAHERGIAVILDLVLNHTSIDHPWFQASRHPASPKRDWYVWSDTPPARNQGAWHALDGAWYLGQFWEGMPDLNLENPEVTDELVATASAWIEDFGIDGFRLDAVRHLVEEGDTLVNTASSRAWLAAYRTRVRAAHPEALFLAEVFDITAASSAFVRDGAADLAFDFPLARGLWQAANLEDTAPLAGARADALAQYPRGGYAAFLTNHDQNRVLSELGGAGARDAAKLAAGLLLTDAGVPFVYYGEEIGTLGRKPDEDLRRPLAWTDDPATGGFTNATPWATPGEAPGGPVARQAADAGSLLATYRDLVALRTAHPSLRTGATYAVATPTTAVSAVLRATPDEALLVLANLAAAPTPGPSLSLAAGPLCGALAASVVYATAGADGAPAAPLGDVEPPAATAAGGFDAWTPVAQLPGRTLVVVRVAATP